MISATCTKCGQVQKYKPEFLGKKARCRACGTAYLIKDSGSPEAPTDKIAPLPPMEAGYRPCPLCGKAIRDVARRCKYCKQKVEADELIPVAKEAPEGEKACPYCGTEIPAVARKCPFCQEFLDESLRRKRRWERSMETHARASRFASEDDFTSGDWIISIIAVILCPGLAFLACIIAVIIDLARGRSRRAAIHGWLLAASLIWTIIVIFINESSRHRPY